MCWALLSNFPSFNATERLFISNWERISKIPKSPKKNPQNPEITQNPKKSQNPKIIKNLQRSQKISKNPLKS